MAILQCVCVCVCAHKWCYNVSGGCSFICAKWTYPLIVSFASHSQLDSLSLNISRVSIKFGRPLLWARFTCFTSYIGCGMPNATSMEPVRSCADWSTAEESPNDYTIPPLTIIIINYLCKWNYSNSIFFCLVSFASYDKRTNLLRNWISNEA